PGDDLRRGERLGHISFGSRADVLLPASVDSADVAVARGEKVRAGETVLARYDG
ncbi:phosphatidylserine decarboxylase family protein, partial [Halobacteriales archaeon SW_6_65_15]